MPRGMCIPGNCIVVLKDSAGKKKGLYQKRNFDTAHFHVCVLCLCYQLSPSPIMKMLMVAPKSPARFSNESIASDSSQSSTVFSLTMIRS